MCTDPEQLASSNESIPKGSGQVRSVWQLLGGLFRQESGKAMTCGGKKRDLCLIRSTAHYFILIPTDFW